MKKILSVFIAAVMMVGVFSVAKATMTFTASVGALAASASFTKSGSNLLVILTNTSAADVLVPVDVLTAVFFDILGDPTLTRTSAVVTGGSSVLFGGTDPGGVVGGEWAYKNISTSGLPGQGISSAGFSIFGGSDRFPGNNLQGPDSPDGIQYGLTSAGDNSATGNTPVTGSNALIQNSVTFTLGNFYGMESHISNIVFQYGTSLCEPRIPEIPEPATILLLGSGLLGAAGFARIRRKK